MAEKIDAERAAPDLLPCPFCGSHNIKAFAYGQTIGGEPDAFAQCQECGTTGPSGKDEDEATEAWNRRTSPSIGEDGLPKLPRFPKHYLLLSDEEGSDEYPVFVMAQMAEYARQYAREAIAADRRAREEAGNALNYILPHEVTVTNYGNPVDKSPQAAQGVKRWQDRLPSTHVPTTSDFVQARDEEIADLRAQLARQSQEPVAWLYKWIGAYGVRKPGDIIARTPAELGGHVDLHPRNWERLSPLYAAPPLSSEQQAEKGKI